MDSAVLARVSVMVAGARFFQNVFECCFVRIGNSFTHGIHTFHHLLFNSQKRSTFLFDECFEYCIKAGRCAGGRNSILLLPGSQFCWNQNKFKESYLPVEFVFSFTPGHFNVFNLPDLWKHSSTIGLFKTLSSFTSIGSLVSIPAIFYRYRATANYAD